MRAPFVAELALVSVPRRTVWSLARLTTWLALSGLAGCAPSSVRPTPPTPSGPPVVAAQAEVASEPAERPPTSTNEPRARGCPAPLAPRAWGSLLGQASAPPGWVVEPCGQDPARLCVTSDGKQVGTVLLCTQALAGHPADVPFDWTPRPPRPAENPHEYASLAMDEARARHAREGRWLERAGEWAEGHAAAFEIRAAARGASRQGDRMTGRALVGQREGVRFGLSAVTSTGLVDEEQVGFAAADGTTLYVALATRSAFALEGAFSDVQTWQKWLPHFEQTIYQLALPVRPCDPFPRATIDVRDQVGRSDDFDRFRAGLRRALRARDAAFFRAHTSFDSKAQGWFSKGTLEDFGVDDPASPFWDDLEKALAAGCARYAEGRQWACPTVFVNWDNDLRDPFEYVAAVGTKVEVRAAPREDAPVLATLSNEIVRATGYAGDLPLADRRWERIMLPDGRPGYAPAHQIYSPVGYRGGFARVGRAWKLTWFVAGD